MGSPEGYGLRKPAAPAEIGYMPGVCLKKLHQNALKTSKFNKTRTDEKKRHPQKNRKFGNEIC